MILSESLFQVWIYYALGCYRYIELNPVRANMVEHPAEYPWSSYKFNALGEPNQLVVPHELYKQPGKNSSDRREAYRDLFSVNVPRKTVDEIREATNKSWILGSEYFKDMIEDKINRPLNPRARGGDRKSEKFKKKSIESDPIDFIDLPLIVLLDEAC